MSNMLKLEDTEMIVDFTRSAIKKDWPVAANNNRFKVVLYNPPTEDVSIKTMYHGKDNYIGLSIVAVVEGRLCNNLACCDWCLGLKLRIESRRAF